MREMITKLNDAFVGFNVSGGFFNGHFHKDACGEYRRDVYPIPVIGVAGLCDIELDIDIIRVTSKLTKNQIISFDWSAFEDVSFDVYGVENYLTDYGNNQSVDAIKDVVPSSLESEFFISFFMSIGTSDEQVVSFLRLLYKYDFYY